MKTQFHRILVIDDDLDEQFLTAFVLKKVLPGGSSIQVVNGGNEAIMYMIGEGKYADRKAYPFPTLLITDLNMPDGDGFNVLEFVRSNPAWSVVPRIVFSSSSNDDDVRTAFLLGASAYHLKPNTIDELRKRMTQIIEYWATSEVPPVDENGRVDATTSGRRGERYPQPQGGERMIRCDKPDVTTEE